MARAKKSLIQGSAGAWGVNRQLHRDHRSKKGRRKFKFADALLAHHRKKLEELELKELMMENAI